VRGSHCWVDSFERSLASHSALRFRAAAAEAFLAQASRSSRVMFLAAVLRPRQPNFLPRPRG
jgi:hypothetical protein